MSFQEKMHKGSNAKTIRPQTKKNVVLKREEEEEEVSSSSKEEESLTDESEEEEIQRTPKKSQRKLSSPSKRSVKSRVQPPLLGITNPVPEAQNKQDYIDPDKPTNIIWVVKTESLPPLVIDPN